MSINQNVVPSALPNFRNPGIILRILLVVEGAWITAALIKAGTTRPLINEIFNSSELQPILMLSLFVLAGANARLHRMRYAYAIAMIVVFELTLTTIFYFVNVIMFNDATAALGRYWIFSLLLTGFLITYFDLRGRALSPALTEARLQALQARIRPHFLFNSINAVLSLIREDPRRAENALEDLAEVFRTMMADNRELNLLAREIDMAKQYLSIEQLRLGPRLSAIWETAEIPGTALIPPRVLQPLLENAVYNGIEPRSTAAVISIRTWREGDNMHLVLMHPLPQETGRDSSHQVMLAQVRERLTFHFDIGAILKTSTLQDALEVHVILPYKENNA